MKQKYLILLLLTGTYYSVCGQIFLGVKGGVNINNTMIKSDPSGFPDISDPTTSFHGGLFAKFKIGKKLLFIPELQFIQKGYSITSYSNGTTKNITKFCINYIEIPTLISYPILRNLNVDFGLVSGIKISAYGKSGEERKNVTEDFDSTLDFGLALGIQINLTHNLGLSSRYVLSLTPLDESDPSISSQIVKEYNRNILISLTFAMEKPNKTK